MEMTPPFDDGPALRVPPHSAEAEQHVLGAILQWPKEALPEISDTIQAGDFYRHEHQVIFAAIVDAAARGIEVDVIVVYELLQERGQADAAGGLAYLNELFTCVSTPRNARRHAEIVAERSTLRALIAATDTIATAAFSTQGRNVVDLLDDAKVALSRIAARGRASEGRHVPLLGLDALRQSAQAVAWLCKRVIPSDSIGMLFGGSGTFKSYIALDLALHVCHGLPWMGRKTKAGAVLFIAAEGGAGLWPRIEAWHRARGLDWRKAPLHVVPVAVDLGQDAWRVVDAAQLAGITPALVVVDTLSQTYSGEENSANEMAAYLRALGQRFRALWHCTVLLIHHSGHAATERPRGSSAIRANVDFLLGVWRDEKEMLATLACIKQKDGELFDDATFQLTPHKLGFDDDGDETSQLAARHLSTSDEVSQAMEGESKAGRGGKNQLLLRLLSNGMKEVDLRKAFYEDCDLDSTDAKRQAYHRAKAWAMKAGFFEVGQGIVIVTKAFG